jgi:hypothetical protein
MTTADFEGHVAVDKRPDGKFLARWNRRANWLSGWQDVGLFKTEREAWRAARKFAAQEDHPIKSVHALLDRAADLIEAGPRVDLRAREWRDWDKWQHVFRELREPDRTQIPFQRLGMKPNGGARNLRRLFREATPEEVDYWGHWYRRAHDVVAQMATRHQVPFAVAAGVTALLSPGNRWWINVRAADKLLTFWRAGILSSIRPSTYPDQFKKALDFLATFDRDGRIDLSGIDSPKVSVFFRSLADPDGLAHDIVLDSHAINVWRGAKIPIKGTGQPTVEERANMLRDYRRVANEVGVTPQGLQAILWFLWKNTTGTDAMEDAGEDSGDIDEAA